MLEKQIELRILSAMLHIALIAATVTLSLYGASTLAGPYKRPLPAEIVSPDVLDNEGKPLYPRRQQNTFEPDKSTELLFGKIESLTLEGHYLVKSKNDQLAELRFKKALVLYDQAEKQYPSALTKHLIDKAELLEEYASLLRRTKRETESLHCETLASKIRQSLRQTPANVRTYSNGFKTLLRVDRPK